MKTCSKCNIPKELEEFNKRSKSIDGYQGRCKECNKESLKKHYDSDKSYYLNKTSKRRKRNKSYVLDIKAQHSCRACGESESICLDFHHLYDKNVNIADMYSAGCSLSKIDEEISKCVILCSNCHRKLHAGLIKI